MEYLNNEALTATQANTAISNSFQLMRGSVNLFDKSVFYSGYINTSGEIIAHGTAKYTDYLAVEPSVTYSFQGGYGQSTRLAYYDIDKNLISVYPAGDTTVIAKTSTTITTPASCKFIRLTIGSVDRFMIQAGAIQTKYEEYETKYIKESYLDNKKLAGLNVVCFGDSITSNLNGWIPTFATSIGSNNVLNYAISGQKICWRAGTTETSNPPTDAHDNNVLWNSIKKFIKANPFAPDIIIIAEGTNDISQSSPLGSYEDAFAQTQILTSQQTMAGAFRKAIYYLMTLYPKAHIFYCTPIQSISGGRNYTNLTNVGNICRAIANRMNVSVIEMTVSSGITEELEAYAAAGKYLYDGIHPNEEGRALMGRVIAQNVITKYNS